MAGVTKEEIARAKELDLLTYFKLVEPGNLKLVGKEYRHKVHSSLTISKNSLWCWHCIGLRGRTALKYLIDVEKVPYVEAVREINRIQGSVVHSSQPVSLPQPRAEPEAPRDFKLPKPRSVFTILKSLSEKDLIHDVGYVRTGKTYSRKFAPKVSRAEYLAMQVMNELPDQELPEFLEFFQGKVG